MGFNASEIEIDRLHHVFMEFEQDGKTLKYEAYAPEDGCTEGNNKMILTTEEGD